MKIPLSRSPWYIIGLSTTSPVPLNHRQWQCDLFSPPAGTDAGG
ncbi:hypothetical protein [Methanoregula sp.]